jgi:hypothetical protein
MCEFCLNPNQSGDRDAEHIDFAGFFSPDAIDQAVRQANENRATQESEEGDDDDDDDDGT